MNKVILTGNTTKDIELRTTPSGKSVCGFTIAVTGRKNKEGERRTDFIDCSAFGATAELLVKYVKKGNKIGVIGELQKDEYTAQDGTKRYPVRVLVSEVEFMGGKKTENNEPQKPADVNEFDYIDDEDMPF